MEVIENEKTPAEKLKDYINNRGIKYTWLAEQMGFTPAWLTQVLSGKRSLTESNKKQIEDILQIKL